MANNAIHAALDEYQTFTSSTAVFPPAYADQYLGLGLGDESGELLEKVLDTQSIASPRIKAILSECGDVLWYLAQSLQLHGFLLSDVYRRGRALHGTHEATLRGAACEVVIAAAGIQGRLKKHLRDGSFDETRYLDCAARLINGVEAVALALGSNLMLLLVENRTKLEGRRVRNTIQGEGDIR